MDQVIGTVVSLVVVLAFFAVFLAAFVWLPLRMVKRARASYRAAGAASLFTYLFLLVPLMYLAAGSGGPVDFATMTQVLATYAIVMLLGCGAWCLLVVRKHKLHG